MVSVSDIQVYSTVRVLSVKVTSADWLPSQSPLFSVYEYPISKLFYVHATTKTGSYKRCILRLIQENVVFQNTLNYKNALSVCSKQRNLDYRLCFNPTLY